MKSMRFKGSESNGIIANWASVNDAVNAQRSRRKGCKAVFVFMNTERPMGQQGSSNPDDKTILDTYVSRVVRADRRVVVVRHFAPPRPPFAPTPSTYARLFAPTDTDNCWSQIY